MSANDRGLSALLAWGAGLLLTAAALMFAHLALTGTDYLKMLRLKAHQLRTLQTLQAASARDEAAVAAWSARSGERPAALPDLLRQAGVNGQLRSRDPRPAAQGWTARAADVIFDGVKLEEAARFLDAAERQQPPWRAVEISVVPGEPGRGRMAVTLETLEKTP